MTLALREWQANFAAQLAGGGGEARLAIHRHHIKRSLAKALAGTFPTVQALVGTEFFRQTAEAFAAENLPTQPVLAEYGAAFADFLAAQEAVHGLAYLADVARLDWALNAAFYSPRGPRLGAGDLAGLPPEQLAVDPPGHRSEPVELLQAYFFESGAFQKPAQSASRKALRVSQRPVERSI